MQIHLVRFFSNENSSVAWCHGDESKDDDYEHHCTVAFFRKHTADRADVVADARGLLVLAGIASCMTRGLSGKFILACGASLLALLGHVALVTILEPSCASSALRQYSSISTPIF